MLVAVAELPIDELESIELEGLCPGRGYAAPAAPCRGPDDPAGGALNACFCVLGLKAGAAFGPPWLPGCGCEFGGDDRRGFAAAAFHRSFAGGGDEVAMGSRFTGFRASGLPAPVRGWSPGASRPPRGRLGSVVPIGSGSRDEGGTPPIWLASSKPVGSNGVAPAFRRGLGLEPMLPTRNGGGALDPRAGRRRLWYSYVTVIWSE